MWTLKTSTNNISNMNTWFRWWSTLRCVPFSASTHHLWMNKRTANHEFIVTMERRWFSLSHSFLRHNLNFCFASSCVLSLYDKHGLQLPPYHPLDLNQTNGTVWRQLRGVCCRCGGMAAQLSVCQSVCLSGVSPQCPCPGSQRQAAAPASPAAH